MNYLLLSVVITINFLQQIFQKQYNISFEGKKNSEFNCVFFISLSAFLMCTIITLFKGVEINLQSLPYALAFGLFIGGSMLFQLFAIKTGPLSITALVMSCSLIIPTLYGIIFCNENLSLCGIIGIVCVFVAFPLIVDYGKKESVDSKKYYIYLITAALSNGGCSTMLKVHEQKFAGQYSSFFTIVGYAFVAIIMLVLLLNNKMGNVDNKLKIKGIMLSSGSGLMNGFSNTLVLFLTSVMPASIIYPFVSAGGIALAFFASIIFYKERMKGYQYIGYMLGVVSVILLSI